MTRPVGAELLKHTIQHARVVATARVASGRVNRDDIGGTKQRGKVFFVGQPNSDPTSCATRRVS